MKRKKRKLKKKRIALAFLVLVILVGGAFYSIKLLKGDTKIILKENTKYLANDTESISLYTYDSELEELTESISLPRGTKVKAKEKDTKVVEEVTYQIIKHEGESYYLEEKYLVDNENDVVLEKSRFVRTSVTIYENETDAKIASFIKKGNELEVIDYDSIDEDGIVNMYKIKSGDIEGWVYAKYLVATKAEADAVYNENGIYDIHKDRKYSRELYGGSASTLDYYPYEKPSFEDNPLLEVAHTMYLNSGVIGNIDAYIQIAVNNGVNAIVVDIKDGVLGYPSEVAKEYSPTAYNYAINSIDSYKAAIDKIKAAGIYAIGRIVVFNDSHYGADHPENCISSSALGYGEWPSAYSRGAWEYNVELAKEAVNLFDFNEIQLDYVRFPESSYNLSINSTTDFKNTYNEEKAEAVQNFIFYAADQIHKVGAYLSVDVFGECSSTYVTAYGQYWPAISNIVDVISSMPYTDHFGRSVDTWSNPYNTYYNWAVGAVTRQKEIETPAVARTWVTTYDVPYWDPVITCDSDYVASQVQALYDAGLTGGFLTWNGRSNINKYNLIKSAWAKTYS